MAAKHTPGPWILELTPDNLWVGTPKVVGHKVADVITSLEWGANYKDEFNARQRANARLIAAAPEMLEALNAIRKEARNNKPDPDEIWGLAFAAIAKAEGR